MHGAEIHGLPTQARDWWQNECSVELTVNRPTVAIWVWVWSTNCECVLCASGRLPIQKRSPDTIVQARHMHVQFKIGKGFDWMIIQYLGPICLSLQSGSTQVWRAINVHRICLSIYSSNNYLDMFCPSACLAEETTSLVGMISRLQVQCCRLVRDSWLGRGKGFSIIHPMRWSGRLEAGGNNWGMLGEEEEKRRHSYMQLFNLSIERHQ